MKNTKLVEEAKSHPTRIYSRPQDVLRDRRLKDVDRLEILMAWERDVRASESPPDEDAMLSRLEDVLQARREVEGRVSSPGTAE